MEKSYWCIYEIKNNILIKIYMYFCFKADYDIWQILQCILPHPLTA